jgi:orotidine-5'-phosphate decarboxylase
LKTPGDYIVFPLDVDSDDKAAGWVRLLKDYVGVFKIGLELFVRYGPKIVHKARDGGARNIFLDIKLHDIPATVGKAMEGVCELGVSFVTVHCGENRRMLEEAVKGARNRVGVLGVTVLTSVSGEDLVKTGYRREFERDVAGLALKKASCAKEAGCTGVVCSGQEVGRIKKEFGKNFLTFVPGIRPGWENMESHDQKRVETPASAIRNGADYLVIGRPIRTAPDPVTAVSRIAEEIGREIFSG